MPRTADCNFHVVALKVEVFPYSSPICLAGMYVVEQSLGQKPRIPKPQTEGDRGSDNPGMSCKKSNFQLCHSVYLRKLRQEDSEF